jgi:hypothetical protein
LNIKCGGRASLKRGKMKNQKLKQAFIIAQPTQYSNGMLLSSKM